MVYKDIKQHNVLESKNWPLKCLLKMANGKTSRNFGAELKESATLVTLFYLQPLMRLEMGEEYFEDLHSCLFYIVQSHSISFLVFLKPFKICAHK